MKILKKSEPKNVEETKVAEAKVEEVKVKAQDDASMVLTSDEIAQLKEALPKLIALLNGEAEIEIIDESTDDTEEIEDSEEVEEVEITDEEAEAVDVDNVETEAEEVEEEKAEDNVSTFNAEEILKDPAKKAALEKALGVTQPAKAGDEQTKAKKVFVKKAIAKKAGDSVDTEETEKPNAELVATPVVKKVISEDRVIRKFDFHKNQK